MFNRLSNAIKARVQQRIVALVLPTWQIGARPDYWDRTFENYVKEGYKRNEIIYACVSVTANTASSVGLKVHDRKTDAPMPDHPLQLLMNRPNRQMAEYDFLSWTLSQQMLGGISYWQKIRNQAGQVMEMWPIRPDYARPEVNEVSGLSEYRIRINGIELETIAARDMVSFPLPDPLNMFDHLSPVEVLSRTADVDNSITDFVKMLMERGAMPPGILTSKLKLRDGDVEDIRRRWSERYGGFANWMQPAVLDSDASYQRIGLTLDELKFEGIDGRNESRICAVYQIPPILVGTTSGLMRSTFSNYESARKQWWEDSLSGKYKKLLDGLQTQLADEYPDQPVLKWDFSNVAALQEERDARYDRANKAWAAGTMLLNEARKEMGLPDLGAEGDVLIRSNMVTAITDNPADDAPQGSGSSGDEVEQDDPAAAAARQRLAQKALTEANAPTPDDAKPKVKPVDAVRWEAMYQQIVKKVRTDEATKVTVPIVDVAEPVT